MKRLCTYSSNLEHIGREKKVVKNCHGPDSPCESVCTESNLFPYPTVYSIPNKTKRLPLKHFFLDLKTIKNISQKKTFLTLLNQGRQLSSQTFFLFCCSEYMFSFYPSLQRRKIKTESFVYLLKAQKMLIFNSSVSLEDDTNWSYISWCNSIPLVGSSTSKT